MSHLNPTPRIILNGIDDHSNRTPVIEPESLPQHLPALFLLTEKSEEVGIASGTYLNNKYGSKTLDIRSTFYNHQSALASTILGEGNQIMVVPVKLPQAKKASLRISVEIIPMTIVSDNGDKRHANRLVWHASEFTKDEGYGEATIKTDYRDGSTTSTVGDNRLGVLVGEDGKEYFAKSILMPIMDLTVDAKGSYGNRLGLILDAPNEKDTLPPDTTLMERVGAYLYRMYLVERPEQSASWSYISNIYANISTDVVLKPQASDTRTGLALSMPELMTSYYQETDGVRVTTMAPFNAPAFYQDNIEMVTKLVAAGHTVTAHDAQGVAKEFIIPGVFANEQEAHDKLYTVNIITGKDIKGQPYSNLTLKDAFLFDGFEWGKNSVVYARGGSDGFPLTEAGNIDKAELAKLYDEEVRRWCDSYNDKSVLFDSAKYPFSALWDSGFSVDTKLSLLKPMGARKDVMVFLSTQSLYDYSDTAKTKFAPVLPNTAAQEIAIASMLESAAHVYPESEIYGTSTCRAAIIGRCGELHNPLIKGNNVPFIMFVAKRIAGYCGAATAIWDSNKAIDSRTNRVDDMFRSLNITYQPLSAYEKSWAAGMIWAQNFDQNQVFVPAYQTVYRDSTSVLDSLLVVIACCYITRVGMQVWRELVGNGQLGVHGFLEESDRLIRERTQNRFGGRFIVEPETVYTASDEVNGYSWTTRVKLYAESMKLVNQFSIQSFRMSDLDTKTSSTI